jgi:UDP-N-acetylglucosamine 2-epimerase
MHGAQTGAMLAGIEAVLLDERPDWVLVYGDTNSTLAGALAAVKLHVPVAHVEAGLRSFNRRMPEEINRVVADQVSAIRFCPSETARAHLAAEGITDGVFVVGDVMAIALRHAVERARERSTILERLGAAHQAYVLVTFHRAENTDDERRLREILAGLDEVGGRVIFPVHPRTRKMMDRLGHRPRPHVTCIDPVGYLDMARLTAGARLIATDSGGLQKEAYWLGVPCLTVRDETEWVETIDAGWNRLVEADRRAIRRQVESFEPPAARPPLYSDDAVAERCVSLLEQWPRGQAGPLPEAPAAAMKTVTP